MSTSVCTFVAVPLHFTEPYGILGPCPSSSRVSFRHRMNRKQLAHHLVPLLHPDHRWTCCHSNENRSAEQNQKSRDNSIQKDHPQPPAEVQDESTAITTRLESALQQLKAQLDEIDEENEQDQVATCEKRKYSREDVEGAISEINNMMTQASKVVTADQEKGKKENSAGGNNKGNNKDQVSSSSSSSLSPKFQNFPFSGPMRPIPIQSKPRQIPDHIVKPDYAFRPNGCPPKDPIIKRTIYVNNKIDIHAMRTVCRMARQVLDAAGWLVLREQNVTTEDIDFLVFQEIIKRGAYPSPLKYYKFPKSCCVSVNEVICHGIPDGYVLKKGDIVNIDVTLYYGGYHGDCSETFLIGGQQNVSPENKKLVKAAYDAQVAGMSVCKHGAYFNAIGAAIEDSLKKHKANFKAYHDFCGHGIGRRFHAEPQVLHFKNDLTRKMKEGHIFTVEPCIARGKGEYITWPDKWTETTKDGAHSAQFEHTILVHKNGYEVLTAKTASSPKYFWEK